MNRDIKFRIWNKEDKCFIFYSPCDPDTISGHGGHSDEDTFYWFSGPANINGKACKLKHFNIAQDTVFQQFTGLKDRNGAEIYEGDIVEYFDWCYASSSIPNGREAIPEEDIYYPLIGVVKWNQKALTYEPLINAQEDYNSNSFAYVCRETEENLSFLNSLGLKNYPDPYYKVIGNIFENSELLKS